MTAVGRVIKLLITLMAYFPTGAAAWKAFVGLGKPGKSFTSNSEGNVKMTEQQNIKKPR